MIVQLGRVPDMVDELTHEMSGAYQKPRSPDRGSGVSQPWRKPEPPARNYRLLPTVVKMVTRLPPAWISRLAAAMLINEATKVYSIAVAPV